MLYGLSMCVFVVRVCGLWDARVWCVCMSVCVCGCVCEVVGWGVDDVVVWCCGVG